MTNYRVTIMRVAGIPIRLDASWFVIALVLTWAMAIRFAALFPRETHPDFTAATYWSMAFGMMIGLFTCLILHEMGHCLMGKRFGMRFRSITLFIFGGVAELESDPRSALAEFWMALAGPAVSLALAGSFWVLAIVGEFVNWFLPLQVIAAELAFLNLILVGFNMLPAFPLDGGRVLRAAMWKLTGNYQRATVFAARMGRGIARAVMILGLVAILAGNPFGGLWFLFIGWFLDSAARSSLADVQVRTVLQGLPIRRFMTTNVTSVPPELNVDQLVQDYLYRQHHRMYPVRTNGRLLGYVTPREISNLPRDEWSRHRVDEIMTSDLDAVQVSPDTDAVDALARMQRTGQSRLLVVDDGTLVGILSLKDLLDYLDLKIELEKPASGS